MRHFGVELLLLQFALIAAMLLWQPLAEALLLDGLTQVEIAPRLGIANGFAFLGSLAIAVMALAVGLWRGAANWVVLAAAEGCLAYGHAQAAFSMIPYING